MTEGASQGAHRLTLADVTPGQMLPELAHEVTTTTVVQGAAAARVWRPMHHDHEYAVHRQGVRDVFMDTQTQGNWLERFVTDWAGPTARLGRLGIAMRTPVFPGDRMAIDGSVRDVETDDSGCGWVVLDLTIRVGTHVCTEAHAKVALPVDATDNPWSRHGDQWQP
jgi:acyl dehydratase